MTLPPPVASILSTVIRAVPAIIPHLAPETVAAIKAGGEYSSIRLNYYILVYQSVYEYLTSSRPVTSFRNAMSRAIVEAFGAATDLGYSESGGELPIDEDTLSWLNGEVEREIGFAGELFARLRNEFEGDADTEATARAEGYASRLDGIHNEAILRGSKNKVAYWRLGQTEKHCPTCGELDGNGHRISWYIDRDYIPRKSGCALSCGGWNCDCRLEDKNGNEITL